MTPLESLSTGVRPHLVFLAGVRAVIFDIYGTLLISAAGDISLVSDSESERGMANALRILGSAGSGEQVDAALQSYRSEILLLQKEARSQGEEFPEVEIREVWKAIASRWNLSEERIEEAALVYECAVNPCDAMPGSSEVIRILREKSYLLGIISNAQFYTEAVVEGASGIELSGGDFEQAISIFSYEEGVGKPSRSLFEKASSNAGKLGLKPEEVLYIGNDWAKDIEPAGEVGFKTALFAGDQRSLRTGALTPDEACRKADVVLTELIQLVEVLRLNK